MRIKFFTCRNCIINAFQKSFFIIFGLTFYKSFLINIFICKGITNSFCICESLFQAKSFVSLLLCVQIASFAKKITFKFHFIGAV